VARRVRVLGSVDLADTEDAFPAARNLELLIESSSVHYDPLRGGSGGGIPYLIELGRLRKERLLREVRQAEDVAASFGRSADQAWWLKLFETARLEVGSEHVLHLHADILGDQGD
jgi:hypothetical protein